tara:strand:+ start:3836 stop:5029 length:1194 start_codon:yes stop_codon:yes gene_type:complete
MLIKMKVPSPGESISEVEISQWLVEEGEYVHKDQTIAEIDSDKATLELPAEESGKISILIEEGDTVAIGEVVCIIDTSVKKQEKPISQDNNAKEYTDTPDKNLSKSNHKDLKATPLANAIISSKNIDVEKLTGTGEKGKITKKDVLNAIVKELSPQNRKSYNKKTTSLRKKIASRLVAVKNETAMLTTFNEVDMNAIFKIREKYKEQFKSKHGVGLGFMSFFTKAVTKALSEFKDVNAMIDGDEIIYYDYSDIGIAVSAPKGLMVPVLRNAELMSFKEIELEIKRLAIKAREGKITIDEMQGGTFTITNGGVFGSMLSTPIINPPQSAILGMHNILERPVVINKEIKIRPMMYVALSYDHRIIDGRESVGFLCRVKEYLESPELSLLENNVEKNLEL